MSSLVIDAPYRTVGRDNLTFSRYECQGVAIPFRAEKVISLDIFSTLQTYFIDSPPQKCYNEFMETTQLPPEKIDRPVSTESPAPPKTEQQQRNIVIGIVIGIIVLL